MIRVSVACLFICALPLSAELAQWDIREGEAQWWREENGVIIGGSLQNRIPTNTFITSRQRYDDFEMTLQVKLVGDTSPNAGIQLRSERVPNHHEMVGYQADVGPNYWGKLYDESRRKRVIGDWVSPEAERAVRPGWNDYRILAEGKRIRIWINRVLTCDFVETDKTIPLSGLIALQTHSGAPFEVHYRNIVIMALD